MDPSTPQVVEAEFDPTSFDDPEIEASFSDEELKDESPVPEESEKEEEEDKETKETGEKAGNKKEKEGSKAEKDAPKDAKAKENSEEEDPPPEEIYKDLDGKEYKGSTKFRKKVHGKYQEVTLKQALDGWSGNMAVQQRFNEANTIKQKAEARERTVNKKLEEATNTIKEFFRHSKEGNPRDATEALCRFTGQDPEQVWAELKKIKAEEFARVSEMSDEELKRAELEEDNAYWKRRYERDLAPKEEDAESRVNAQIEEESRKWGIERSDVQAGYNLLVDLKNRGQYNGPIDAANSARAGFDIRTWEAIDHFVGDRLPDLKGDNSFYSEVLSDTKEYGLSMEDWESLLGEIEGAAKEDKSASEFKRKLKKTSKVAPKKKVEVDEEDEDEEDIVSFDDI